MNGADVFDASWNRCELGFKRMKKWTVVFFFAVLDFIVENARIAYNWFAKKKLRPAAFRLLLADELLSESKLQEVERAQRGRDEELHHLRRARDSPMPLKSMTMEVSSACKFGKLVKHARSCSTIDCKERPRGGCQTHKTMLCVECYAKRHVPTYSNRCKTPPSRSIPLKIEFKKKMTSNISTTKTSC
jgi:hypothetical protein